MSAPANPISLADWRRNVAEVYARVRSTAASDASRAAREFRGERDRLFREHPDSPLRPEKRARFRGTSWYPYDAAWRVKGVVKAAARRTTIEMALAADGSTRCTQFATVEFVIERRAATLALYWFEGYGGGIWLPFADGTNGSSTYGGGRYLYDTIKGADLGCREDELVLDFNFAYNPSCAYDDRWSCPLAPLENRLPFDVPVGERIASL